jgi:hypothetical protein
MQKSQPGQHGTSARVKCKTAVTNSTAAPARRGPARLLGALALVGPVLAACSARGVTSPSHVFKNSPCLLSGTVQLSVADTVRIDCSNGGTTVTFAGAGASYLIVPEFATDQAPFQFINYTVASGTLSPAAASASRVRARVQGPSAAGSAASGWLPPRRPQAAQFAADRLLRARARRQAMSGAFRAYASRAPRALQGAVPRVPPSPGSIRSFHVLSSLAATPAFATVGAQLAYVGSNVLLYVDTLAPTGGFTPSQLQGFGQSFDQVLYPIDTTAFGVPSDIDQNGRVIVLMSQVVNGDTPASTCAIQGYVAGFFNSDDFNGPTDPNSNQGEIFYSIVPDPAGTFSCTHTVAELQDVVPATFVHELQHLISFSQHVVVNGGLPGASWLDEGLSIAAEELGSLHYELQCPPPACRTNPGQLFPDSSQGFIQNFLYDSYEYALLPDTASITLESDADPGMSWRGGAWLLVRWLGDQMGGSGFFRQLERGASGGVADIEQATGQSFPTLFANFGLALYTDSLPGLPRATAPAANRFVTRNVKQLWARLFATSASSSILRPDPVQLFAITADTTTYVLYPGTVTYFRLDTPTSAASVSIRFAAPGGAGFAATLQPQLAVFRLPPGQ